MNFDIIEQKRMSRELTVTKLCKMAGIDRGIYYKMKSNPDSAKFSTANRLVRALKLTATEKSKLFN